MRIGIPKEIFEEERRVAATPEVAAQLKDLGFDVTVETGAGADASFDDDAYQQLNLYPWPGNVRELENVIERAVILKHNGCISAEDLALNNVETDHQLPLYELENRLSLDEYFVSFVKKYQPQFNETELARMLGGVEITRKTLDHAAEMLAGAARKRA